jgi:thiamine biosynthesis protein ThiI
MSARGFTLVKIGEITLKGQNRRYFENRLMDNLRDALKGIRHVRVKKEFGRMYMDYELSDEQEVLEKSQRVFGLVSLCPGVVVEPEFGKISEAAAAQVKALVAETGMKRFKVEARRSDKAFPMTSPEICMNLGGDLLRDVEGLSVDVHKPQFVVNVEVREKAYIYSREIRCHGGMPYGTAGKAVLLLSGGIDSPVAGWMMARRGVTLSAVHFHSYPFTSERAQEKVYELARKLAVFTGSIEVTSINLLEIQQAIMENCPEEEMTILSRRFMMAIAERVALETGGQGLITGENIGQVASQTIEGLTVTNARVKSMPVFRPLIAYDKNDIVEVAKKIDTYETSILPFEDCCTVFLPSKVVTKPRLAVIEASESALDIEGLIDRAMEGKEVLLFERSENNAIYH